MDDGMRTTMMSSENGDWGTPQELFNAVNEIFEFDLDVCATKENTKVPGNFILPEDDAFKVPWIGKGWLNPPYGDPEHVCKPGCKKKKCEKRGYHNKVYKPGIVDWVRRAVAQAEEHESVVVCLLPARTETDWFQIVWDKASMICFIKGRVTFEGAQWTAPFPSVIAVFGFKDEPLFDVMAESMSGLGNVIDPRNGAVIVCSGRRKRHG